MNITSTTMRDTVLKQHFISCGDRMEFGEEYLLLFKKEPDLVY